MRSDAPALERATRQKADPSRPSAPEEVEGADKAAALMALLNSAESRREAGKLKDLDQIRRFAERKTEAMWAPADIQIEGEPGECLAWSGVACMVSLREYNAAALYFRLPKMMPRDSAKAEVLKKYLLEKSQAERARGLGLDQNPDSLLEMSRRDREAMRLLQATLPFGKQVSDLGTLQAYYDRYFQRYFAAREVVALGVIGSSDSGYIDSLHKVFTAWDKRSRSRRAGEPIPVEPALPWIDFKEAELPKEMVAATDSLRVGQCGAPFRSRAGHFLLRLTKADRIEEVPFQKAFPQLVFLATREKYRNMDSVMEATARKYYAEHKAHFALPDTLDLLAWLIPRRARTRAGIEPVSAAARPDTACFRPMPLSSLDLPRDIRISLQDAARKDTLRACFGPLPDKHGFWHFRIRARKTARDTLPFRLVRKEILDKITAPPEAEDRGKATLAGQDEIDLTLVLAQAFRMHRPGPPMGPDPRGGTSAVGPEPTPEAAQLQAQEKRYLASTRMNLARLFR